MKPLSIVVFATLMTIVCLVAHAQPPGYMGRRAVLKADLSILPASPNHYDYPYNWSGNPGFYFNHTETIGFEHVASRRSSVSFTLDLTRMGYRYGYLAQPGRSQASVYGFGLLYKGYPFLRSGYISPIGPYFGIGYRYLHARQHHVPDAPGLLEKQLPSFSAGSFSFMYGYSQVIGDRMMLDLGLKFSFSMIAHAVKGESDLAEKFARADAVKFYLGLGVLLGK
jgi:hypothetical protein